MQRFVVVDLDGTLTVDLSGVAYPDKPLDQRVGASVHAARAAGFGVMVLTARGMRTWSGDRAQVELNVRPGVEAWLRANAVQADQVHVAKPWCGPGGYYIDDRNLHVEEFVFRFTGPFADQPVAVHIIGPITDADRARLLRIERWLDVCAWTDGRSDGRTPALDLEVTVGQRAPNVAGWFAMHAEDPLTLPIVAHDGDSGFRLSRR